MSPERSYRYDPNYYRLLYQLAAQQLNAALIVAENPKQMPLPKLEPLAKPTEAESDPSKKPSSKGAPARDAAKELAELPPTELAQPEQLAEESRPSSGELAEARREWAQKARDTAEDLLREAGGVNAWFNQREKSYARWKLWGAPRMSPPQRRLHRFLASTILPCADLVAAGALLVLGDKGGAAAHAEPWREALADELERPGVRTQARLSYRAVYNLACYEASVHRREQALVALVHALRRVSGERHQLLVNWAKTDPALVPLHPNPRFAELMADFELPEPVEPEPGESEATTVIDAVIVEEAPAEMPAAGRAALVDEAVSRYLQSQIGKEPLSPMAAARKALTGRRLRDQGVLNAFGDWLEQRGWRVAPVESKADQLAYELSASREGARARVQLIPGLRVLRSGMVGDVLERLPGATAASGLGLGTRVLLLAPEVIDAGGAAARLGEHGVSVYQVQENLDGDQTIVHLAGSQLTPDDEADAG